MKTPFISWALFEYRSDPCQGVSPIEALLETVQVVSTGSTRTRTTALVRWLKTTLGESAYEPPCGDQWSNHSAGRDLASHQTAMIGCSKQIIRASEDSGPCLPNGTLPAFLPSIVPHLRHRLAHHHRRLTMSAPPALPLGHPPHGPSIPQVGLGTWKSAPGVVTTVVSAALRAGYRAIDCACDYGTESDVGSGISSALSDAVVKREELFVTSKLWNTFHRAEHVKPALQRTLSDLKVQYLDLYLIHFPISLAYVDPSERYPPEWLKDGKLVEERVPIAETWAAMEKLVDEGLVKHIGVANFSAVLLMDLLSYARIKPAVLQVEMHPYLQQPRLLELCRREGIAVTAFSPLGAGSYVELDMDKGDRLLEDPVLKAIADKKGRSVAQVALRWGVQRGTVVIPKTSKVERLRENIELFDFELDQADMEAIRKLDRGTRYNDPGEFCVGMGKSIPIYD